MQTGQQPRGSTLTRIWNSTSFDFLKRFLDFGGPILAASDETPQRYLRHDAKSILTNMQISHYFIDTIGVSYITSLSVGPFRQRNTGRRTEAILKNAIQKELERLSVGFGWIRLVLVRLEPILMKSPLTRCFCRQSNRRIFQRPFHP